MRRTISWHVAATVTIALALGVQGLAQSAEATRFAGLIDDYTVALDANGPWQVSGQWSVWIKGSSGKGEFSAALQMVRADSPSRSAHTHHLAVKDGVVTTTADGHLRMSGPAIVTSNGTVSMEGSHVEVLIQGGKDFSYTNMTITFFGPAMGHFGPEPLDGVVTNQAVN